MTCLPGQLDDRTQTFGMLGADCGHQAQRQLTAQPPHVQLDSA